jgi:hypothetical protein
VVWSARRRCEVASSFIDRLGRNLGQPWREFDSPPATEGTLESDRLGTRPSSVRTRLGGCRSLDCSGLRTLYSGSFQWKAEALRIIRIPNAIAFSTLSSFSDLLFFYEVLSNPRECFPATSAAFLLLVSLKKAFGVLAVVKLACSGPGQFGGSYHRCLPMQPLRRSFIVLETRTDFLPDLFMIAVQPISLLGI